jgi:hypothetical protein
MKRGFRFAETMSGTYTRRGKGAQARRFSFTAEARAGSVLRHLRDGKTSLRGTLEADGFASGVPIEGTLTMLPFRRRLIRYEFDFVADDGQPYRFAGQKDIRWLAPLRTWTELPGEVRDDDGKLVGTAMTHFNMKKDGISFMRSWKPA